MNVSTEYACPKSKDELLKYLLIKTSPIMLKVKPAVLVRISNCFHSREFQPYEIFCSHQKAILSVLDVDYMIMKNNGNDIQILFYKQEILAETLSVPGIRAFLNEYAYHDTNLVKECLLILRSRFGNADFPHEIGIFLGYPLKDVRGFIEDNKSGTSVPQGRWRVFGDPAESLKAMRLFRFAEDFGRQVVEHYQEVTFCVEKLKSSIITDNMV